MTGHRPDKIRVGRLDAYDSRVYWGLVGFAVHCLEREPPELVITDLRPGWGWAVAQACAESGLRYACIVDKGHREPTAKANRHYRFLLGEGTQIGMSPEDWARCHGSREKFMASHADKLLALWDGSAGGTADTVARAYDIDLPVTNVWTEWLTYSGGAWETTA